MPVISDASQPTAYTRILESADRAITTLRETDRIAGETQDVLESQGRTIGRIENNMTRMEDHIVEADDTLDQFTFMGRLCNGLKRFWNWVCSLVRGLSVSLTSCFRAEPGEQESPTVRVERSVPAVPSPDPFENRLEVMSDLTHGLHGRAVGIGRELDDHNQRLGALMPRVDAATENIRKLTWRTRRVG